MFMTADPMKGSDEEGKQGVSPAGIEFIVAPLGTDKEAAEARRKVSKDFKALCTLARYLWKSQEECTYEHSS